MKRNRTGETDPLAVIFGLLFLAIAGLWMLRHLLLDSADVSGWLIPSLLVAIGTAGLVTALRRGDRVRDNGRDVTGTGNGDEHGEAA